MSARLELLANRHSPVTEALISISASILGIATVLEVLVISKSEHATSLTTKQTYEMRQTSSPGGNGAKIYLSVLRVTLSDSGLFLVLFYGHS